MKSKAMLFAIGAASVLALVPPLSGQDAQPAVAGNLTGTLRIQQGVPSCASNIDQTTPVTGGRLVMTPAEGRNVTGGKEFTLSPVSVFFAPFSISRSCYGFGETRSYAEIGVQLARAVTFRAVPAGGGQWNVTIAKDEFLFRENAIVNGHAETGYKRPSEDVTGTINLDLGTITMRVVVATRIHFKAGCTIFGCVIDEYKDGTLTANISGTITFPDTDLDTVPDRADICRLVSNPLQTPVETPVIMAPESLTVGSCADHSIGVAEALDRCDMNPVSVSDDRPERFLAGENAVTWSVMDSQGRTSRSTQRVTVVDRTLPMFTFVPANVSAKNCGLVDIGQAIATDDCAGTLNIASDAPASFDLGATVVTWSARDASRNVSTARQTITVTDSVPPKASCIPSGEPDHMFRVVASDACTASPSLSFGEFAIDNGETINIVENGKPGVRLVNVIRGIRYFEVGKGEAAVITAADGSGNAAAAVCR